MTTVRTTAAREAALVQPMQFDKCEVQKLCRARIGAVARSCNATDGLPSKCSVSPSRTGRITSEVYITGKETDISTREDVPGAKQV